jgi:hypothetical protein
MSLAPVISEFSITKVPAPPVPFDNWSRKTLKQCLIALGFTLEEIRFRKGARFILQNWTGEERDLFQKVKKKWKALSVRHHEANGGDPEQWKNINSIFSSIEKKMHRYIVEKKPDEYVFFNCMICKKNFKKKLVSWMQLKSSLCDNIECIRTYRRNKARRRRLKHRTTREQFCENDKCHRRMHTQNPIKRFCSRACCLKVWKANNKDRVLAQSRIQHSKRPWKVWYAGLSPEQKTEYNKKTVEKRHNRLANETPEKKAARQARVAAYNKDRRATVKLQKLSQIEIVTTPELQAA